MLLPGVDLIEASELAGWSTRLPQPLQATFKLLQQGCRDDWVLVAPGSICLEASLQWDADAPGMSHEGRRIGALVVDGDLTIQGDLLNLDGENGPGLLVLGSLRVRHLVHGGGLWLIAGSVFASGLVVGHYNHGQLDIGGDLQARALLSDDHGLDVHGALQTSGPEDLSLAPEVLDGRDGALRVDLDTLINRIRNGQHVLDPAPSVLQAVLHADLELLRSTLVPGATEQTGVGGLTPLMWAALASNSLMLELLLSAGAVTAAVDDEGRTALHHAAATGDAESARLLLVAGARVEANDLADHTPLRLAVEHNHGAVAKLLLAAGAMPDARQPALLMRVFSSPHRGHGAFDESLLLALLAAGANVAVTDREGISPMMAAAAMAGPVSLQTLLDRGAALENRVRMGQLNLTALDFAAIENRADNLSWLLGQGTGAALPASTATQLLGLALLGRSALEYGKTPPSLFDPTRESAARLETVSRLLESGARADGRFADLPLTVFSPGPAVLQLLLVAGADANAVDAEGRSVLLLAIAEAPLGREVELARVLLRHGADPWHQAPGETQPLVALVAASGDLALLSVFVAALTADGRCDAQELDRMFSNALRARERNRQLQELQLLLQAALGHGLTTRAEILRYRSTLSVEDLEHQAHRVEQNVQDLLRRWPQLETELAAVRAAHAEQRTADQHDIVRIRALCH